MSKYLLIPVPPTPNGRMHLGHMAGPYLRMDMLRRSLEQDGHEAELWTGTDSHDSFVLYRAHLSKSQPVDVCGKFYPLIEADMRSLGIKVDGFVDTLAGEGRQLQEMHARESVEALKTLGLAEERGETILYDEAHRFPAVGTWLAGRCPECQSPCIGYFCEGCFTHNQPAELQETSSRMPGARLVPRTVDSLFLVIPDSATYLRRLDEMGVLPAAIDVVRKMLATPGRNFRLTVPIDWGLTYKADSHGHPRSIFEILWEVYTYSEMQAAKSAGLVPAWRADSDIKVIVACGVDNTVPLLMGCVGVYSNLPEAKPPEHIHINYFVKLEGTKFSTNRNHAIWAGDLANVCQGNADGIRLHLARISPEGSSTNFDVAEFVRHYNEFYVEQLFCSVAWALSSLDGHAEPCPDSAAEVAAYRKRIGAALSPRTLCVSDGVAVFEEWVAAGPPGRSKASKAKSDYWWLKGVAVLGYAFAPELCGRIWKLLGHDGIPTVNEMLAVPAPTGAGHSLGSLPQRIGESDVKDLIGRPL